MKSLFGEFVGAYRKETDYVIPNLEMSDTENFEIGTYGQQYLHFLIHYCRIIYINLLTSGNLNEYLIKIDSQAQERFMRICVEQMKQEHGITEQLEVINPIKRTPPMSCIRQQANDIIFAELNRT